MHYRLPHRRQGLSVITALALLVGVVAFGATDASAADSDAPILTAYTVSPRTTGPDQAVTVDYVVDEAAGSLSGITFRFVSGSDQYVATASGPVPVSGTITLTLPDGARNATYGLSSVMLADPSGNTSNAYSNGSMTYSAGATGPATNPVSFAAGSVTLTGSTEDHTPPVLTAASMADPTLVVGDTATVQYQGQDDHLFTSVVVAYHNAAVRFSTTVKTTGPALPTAGEFTGAVAPTWANGTYVATYVRIVDQYRNSATYWPDGLLTTSQGTTRHTVDLAPLTFSVSGSEADFTAPVLGSVGPTTTTALGGTASLPYTTTDAQGGLGTITATYDDGYGNGFSLSQTDAPLSGVLTGTAAPSPNLAVGTYRLTQLVVEDTGHQKATYHRGGRLDLVGGTSQHTIDLSRGDIVVAGPPTDVPWVSVVPGASSATVQWDLPGDGGTPVTGYTVTVAPSGKVVSVGGTARSATVTGLTNLTRYTFTVRAKNVVGTGAGRSATGMPRAYGLRILSPGDFDRDGHNDILAVNRSGTMYSFRGNGHGGFASAGKAIRGDWRPERLVLAMKGPRECCLGPDAWSIGFDGTLTAHETWGQSGAFLIDEARGHGWDSFAKVFTPGDFGRDGYPDVMGITDAGDLYYYPYRWQNGNLYSGVRIGSGWKAFSQVFGVGDQTGDGRNDLMAIKPDGTLWLYAANGRGGLAAGKRIGSGWGGARAVFSIDFDGGGPDVLTVDAKGDLRLYRGNNRGGLSSRGIIGRGWSAFL